METMEPRLLLSVSNLQIVSIASPGDLDGAVDQYVTVKAGDTVTATFSYNSTETETTQASFNIADLVSTTGTVASGDGQTGLLSVIIPDGTAEGIYEAHVQVKNGKGSGSVGNESLSAAVTIYIVVAAEPVNPAITVAGGTFTYDGQGHGVTISAVQANGDDLADDVVVTYTDASGIVLGGLPVYAGTYTANWSYAGSDAYNAASGSATITISQKTLDVVATTQESLNIAKSGMISFAVNVTDGCMVDGVSALDGQTLAQMFNGASISISLDGTSYSTEVLASVENGVVVFGIRMNDALQTALTTLLNGSEDTTKVGASLSLSGAAFSVSGDSNDGNYTFDADALTRIFLQAAKK